MKPRNCFQSLELNYKVRRLASGRHRAAAKPHALLGPALAGFAWLAVTGALSAQAVPLGMATNFPIVSSQGVTSSGFTIVDGNIALSPLTTITGFTFSTPAGDGIVNGTVHYNDAVAMQAQADSLTAYNTLAGMAYSPANDLTGLDLGGMTLYPGVYHFETSAGLTGNLTLDSLSDPNAVFVFQVGSTLTAAVGSSIVLAGGGTPSVFWQVGSSATFNSNSAFTGNILAMASVSMGTDASLSDGRLIALNGAVTLLGNAVSSPDLVLTATGRYWNGSAGNLWSGATNWSPTAEGLDQVALGSDADVVFSITSGAQNHNTLLDSNVTISSLTVNDAAAVTISGANTLTLSASGLVTGVHINSGAGLTTIHSNLALGHLSQAVTVNNSAGLLVSGVISGGNGLTKAGTGVLTLTGAATYSGATVVSGGTLQLGDGLTAGSSIASSNAVMVADFLGTPSVLALNLSSGESFGNRVTNNGQIRWIAQGLNYQAPASVFSGNGSMLVTAAGTTVLLGSNSFSGGATINTSGRVLAGTATAFGSGVLTLENGYIDTYNSASLPIQVGGYVQSGGEIAMHVAGATPGTHTSYQVSGSATLSGGTVFAYDLGGSYLPQGGDIQNIVHTTGGLSGQFGSNAPYSRFYSAELGEEFFFHQGDTLLYPLVTYDPANAYLTWVQDSFQSLPILTPNHYEVGGALDEINVLNPSDPGVVVTYLNGQNTADLPAMYDLIAPDELTALFQIGFSNAEIQNANIQRHLEQVRRHSTTSATAVMPSSKDSRHSKGGLGAQESYETPESRRWSVFIEGTGGSASVDGDSNAHGYDFDTMGATVGADYRVSDRLVVGILGAYADSDASLSQHGSIEMDTYKAALYATAYANGFFVDALLGAGYNSYDTSRSALLGQAKGDTDGWELDSLVNVGYDFQIGNWAITPMASVAYTRINLNDFHETGSLAPLSYPDQHQDSLRTNLGAKIAYTARVNSMIITPQVRLAWQHEFLDNTLSMDSRFAGGSSPMFTVDGPGTDRDRALLSAGITVQITPSICAYAFYDGQLGGSSYNSNSVSGGLKLEF